MNNFSLFFAVAFVVLFIIGAIWLTQLERKRLRQNVELFAGIGFQPLLKLDPQLSEQIIAHYRRGRGIRGGRSGVRVIGARPLQVKNVFQRSHPDGDLLVYDIWDRAAEVGQVAQGAVAIIRHGACLPCFKIYALGTSGGLASAVTIQFLAKAKGQGTPVSFADLPEFSQHFTVMATGADSEDAVRSYLTPTVRQQLAGCKFFILVAGGDVLAIEDIKIQTAKPAERLEIVRRLSDQVLQLAQTLVPAK
jgi:hypothetical protein